MTSIFLARELGLRIWAADLWMDPDNNWKRIVTAGEQDRICPLRCEWNGSKMLTGIEVDTLIDAWRHWRDFERAVELSGKGIFPACIEALEKKDRDAYIGFHRLVARRTDAIEENIYSPDLGVRAGVEG